MRKIALVTGGTKGLGKAISVRLTGENYRVYALSRNPEPSLEKVMLIKADVSDEKECETAVKAILKKELRLDLLVNNAGVNDEENILTTFGVNVFGPYFLIKHSLGALKKNRGRIINITSLNGLVPTPNSSVYSASKHAIEGLGMALSYELEKQGVYVTNIAPGAIYDSNTKPLTHKPLREKFILLKILFPMLTREKVVEAVLSVVKSERPPKRLMLGLDAKVSYFISRMFPDLWNFALRKLY
ncbi:hypothetical protein A2803_03980 [Candidatus Woesebacteria bacterium RIFCSPHIGHO2_01_FULL_44_21]|uniref:Short-chain dehydrogenase n=1 Tax=Candidatus Woesebacteria bacterium RIFCSPHIGHO2_01_FULL_44_21 TaxID=1802503 RepID=A0A1F7YVX9_9BACT|nr:MAG: hypothetical protein A2803_03980 [Candidatus Woesebacteria bacterium RIFCSPHIGHO2_01_FULL_44_21]